MAKTKEAKIKEFKIAFLKPKAADRATVKIKTDLEKAVKNAKNKEGQKKDVAQNAVDTVALRLAKQDPGYYEELLAYKLTKHWDDPHELKMWTERGAGAPKHVVAALKKVFGATPSEDFLKKAWTQFGDIQGVTDLIHEIAPDLLLNEVVAYIDKNKMPPRLDSDALKSEVVVSLFEKGNRGEIPAVIRKSLTAEAAGDLAMADPTGFSKIFLRNIDEDAKLKFIGNPKVREAIAKDAKDWKELCDSMPMLALFDNVNKAMAKLDVDEKDKPKAAVATLFEQLLATDSPLKATYYTNNHTRPVDILVQDPNKSQANVTKKLNDAPKEDKGVMPDEPAAQCDELVSLLKSMTEAVLGPGTDVEVKHIVIPSMVLTVPLSNVPGGMLKKTFEGNVFDDSKTRTGQVLFTGITDGGDPNAHTYLEVGGMKYDAVLGTKGKEVDDSIADEFGPWDKSNWVLQDEKNKKEEQVWVSKSKRTANYVIKEPGLDAPTNKNGFKTSYRLTTKPENYVVKKK